MRKFTYLTHKDKKQKKWKTQKSIKHTLNPSFPFSLFFVLFKKSRKKNQEKNHGAAPCSLLVRSLLCCCALAVVGFLSPSDAFERENNLFMYTYLYILEIYYFFTD
jgi:hypothetical protein